MLRAAHSFSLLSLHLLSHPTTPAPLPCPKSHRPSRSHTVRGTGITNEPLTDSPRALLQFPATVVPWSSTLIRFWTTRGTTGVAPNCLAHHTIMIDEASRMVTGSYRTSSNQKSCLAFDQMFCQSRMVHVCRETNPQYENVFDCHRWSFFYSLALERHDLTAACIV